LSSGRLSSLNGPAYRWFRICDLLRAQLRSGGRDLSGWFLLTPIADKMRSDIGEAQPNRANCPAAEFWDETPYSGTLFSVRLGLRFRWLRNRWRGRSRETTRVFRRGKSGEATRDYRRGRIGPGLYVPNLGFWNRQFVSL
jgi:hypothetical protein